MRHKSSRNLLCVYRIVFISIFLLYEGSAPELTIHAQERAVQEGQSVPNITNETYTQVLNLIFPLDVLEDKDAEFVIVLRFTPTFQANSQVTIVKRRARYEITEYMSSSGNVYSKLNDILENTGREDVSEMAKMIPIKKRTVRVTTALVEDWHRTLIRDICTSLQRATINSRDKSKGTTVVLDGTTYNLWYRYKAAKLSFSAYGSEVDFKPSSVDPQIVLLMKGIWRTLKKSS